MAHSRCVARVCFRLIYARCRMKKIAPQKNRRRAIFSQTVIVQHRPLGDLFTIAVSEKITPRRLFTIAVCEIIAPYCLIARNSPPRRKLFERGRFYHVVTKSLLSWKTRPSVVTLVVLRMIWNQLIWNCDLKSFFNDLRIWFR